MATNYDTNPFTILGRRFTREEARKSVELEQSGLYDEVVRPRTRGDCECGPRPCPWVSCKHHLYLYLTETSGTTEGGHSIRLIFPRVPVWEMPFTCALDVVQGGELTLEEIGVMLNMTGERVRQIVEKSVERVKHLHLFEGAGVEKAAYRARDDKPFDIMEANLSDQKNLETALELIKEEQRQSSERQERLWRVVDALVEQRPKSAPASKPSLPAQPERPEPDRSKPPSAFPGKKDLSRLIDPKRISADPSQMTTFQVRYALGGVTTNYIITLVSRGKLPAPVGKQGRLTLYDTRAVYEKIRGRWPCEVDPEIPGTDKRLSDLDSLDS